MELTKDCSIKSGQFGKTFIAKSQNSGCTALKNISRSGRRILYLTFAVNLILFGPCWAATYYIDPANGNDSSGNGAYNNPWQTLNKAKSTVSPGDTVNLLPGDYGSVTFGETGDRYGADWSNPIIYQNNPTSPPYSARFSRIVFKGQHNFYTIISGVDIKNSTATDCISIGGIEDNLKNSAHIKIIDCKVHGSAGVSGPTNALIYMQSSNNILIEDCEVYDSGSLCWGINAQDCQYVTVRGCHIHDIARSALRTGWGTYYTFEYNHIHTQRPEWGNDPHGSGISIHSNNTTIRGNIVHDGWNTRTIRFYQDVAGPDGYHDMLVENNLFYDGLNWSEFIDLGNNCVFRNNTFGEYVNMVFAQNADGSGLSIYNNIFASTLQLQNYNADRTNDTYEQARSKWDAVNEGNNIFTRLVAPGNNYLWEYPCFSATSNSMVVNSLDVGTYFVAKSGTDAYQLCEGSPAIDFGSSAYAPATDLLGNSRVGPPDAGCYEYNSSTSPPDNQPPTANAGPDQTVIDTDENGYEQVVLNGSVSTDPDGTIAGYVWTENGNQIAAGVNPTASLSSGQHTITLTITDNGGLTDSDTVVITVAAGDQIAPSIVSITASENSVEILFSETLAPFSVGDIGNYNIDNGITIYQATLSNDGVTVLLTTSVQTEQIVYTLTCRDITDLAGNKMAETLKTYIYSSNLVGYWQFNEAVGLVAVDSSGNSNTATLINGPLWNQQWGITFDGINDYLDCGNDSSLNVTDSLTITACINAASFGQGGWGRIVDKGNGSTGYSFYLNSANNAIKYVAYGHNTTSSSAGIIELNKWQHVAVVYDESSATATFYLDGEEAGTTSYSTAPADSSNSPLVIGIRGYDLNRAFDGSIDNVRIYNRALDADEILNVFEDDFPFTFYPVGDRQVDENSNLTFEVITQLPDTTVTINNHNLPAEPGFEHNIFNWTPTYDDAGSYYVTFAASNGQIEDLETITITVNNVNRSPVIEPVGDKTVDTDTLLTFSVHTSDPDGDSVSCTAHNLPDGAVFSANIFKWTPESNQTGTYEISFVATDGQLQTGEDITITVNSVLNPDEDIIIDNGDERTSCTGIWAVSGGADPYATDSLWSRDGSVYNWIFSPPASGSYNLSMWWTQWSSRNTNIPVEIEHAGGKTIIYINQQQNGGQWNSLGDYQFEAGLNYRITITAQPGPTSTCADAVKFTKNSPSEIIIDNSDEQTSSTGTWGISGGADPYGTDSLWSRDGSVYNWIFSPPASASYNLSMWWTQWPSRSTNIPVEIEHAGGKTIIYINQQQCGGQWNDFGDYLFEAGSDYRITITAQPGPTSTCADAVKFVLLD